MEEKHNENLNKEDVEEVSYQDKNGKEKSSKLLNFLLSIIVLITVVTGSIIYYSLYKYSNTDTEQNIDNNVQDDDVSTVADILDTALNTNTTIENTITDDYIASRKFYSNNR